MRAQVGWEAARLQWFLRCCVAGAICFCSIASPAFAQRARGNDFGSGASAVKRNFIGDQGLPWYWSLAANLEALRNEGGGLREGTAIGHLINAAVALNGDVIGLPAGSRFKVSAISVGSDLPSRDLVGDAQGVSNIEAAAGTRIYELWYRQQFRHAPVRLRAGLLDLNQSFDVVATASSLLNSAFGISPALAGNVQTPVYPMPGWGVMGRWRGSHWQLQSGLFSGTPNDRSRLNARPPLSIVELDSIALPGSANPRWMLGLWRKRDARGQIRAGLYAALERSLSSRVRGFLQVGRTPGEHAQLGTAVAAGIDIAHPWGGRANDSLGVGVARASLVDAPDAETTIEGTYLFNLSSAFALQPDVQYVRHPSGELRSTWVVGLRFDLGIDRRTFMRK